MRRTPAHHLHQLPAIEPRQHDVEDHQVERLLLDQMFAVDAVARDLHTVAGLLQPTLEVVGRLGLVLHHQNSHRITSLNVRRRSLKNVSEAASARRKEAKKRSLQVVNEHFEPVFNAAMATQVVLQLPARLGSRRTASHYKSVMRRQRF